MDTEGHSQSRAVTNSKSRGLTIHQIPDSGPHIKPQTKFHQTASSRATNQHTEITSRARISRTPTGGSQYTTSAPYNPISPSKISKGNKWDKSNTSAWDIIGGA
ncbi:hypothetical protein Nepgr_023075 [Nepenthes gracilis]|uniref:Uncharacterized protein n=1 Tax=Nepenthes gracilis TaxID=150966 RepID=A0AAD3T1E8_NEPGR|nr:hypothetical protein Nepgr_023075 [Nepenthes gracilis]